MTGEKEENHHEGIIKLSSKDVWAGVWILMAASGSSAKHHSQLVNGHMPTLATNVRIWQCLIALSYEERGGMRREISQNLQRDDFDHHLQRWHARHLD